MNIAKKSNSNRKPGNIRAINTLQAFDRPIALVGMMGCGKSDIGRRLAKRLQLQFVDTDQLVTKLAGVSIRDIFDLAGEDKFRDMEFRVICTQLQKPPHVLATGGGAFCEHRSASLLREKSLVVWLKASPETLLNRIGDTSSRPLLQTGPPLQILKKLQETRVPFYKKAHIHLNTNGLTAQESTTELSEALDSYQAKQ